MYMERKNILHTIIINSIHTVKCERFLEFYFFLLNK